MIKSVVRSTSEVLVKNFLPIHGKFERNGTALVSYLLSDPNKPAITIDSSFWTLIVVVDTLFFTHGIFWSGPIKS